MKNRLSDLNNHLFAQLERLNDEDLDGEKLDKEVRRATAIAKTAQTIVNSARLELDAIMGAAEWNIKKYTSLIDGTKIERERDER